MSDDIFTMCRYGSFEDGDAKLDEVEMVEGFEIALKKLTEWVGTNVNNKTKIYFAGSSPTHTWWDQKLRQPVDNFFSQ